MDFEQHRQTAAFTPGPPVFADLVPPLQPCWNYLLPGTALESPVVLIFLISLVHLGGPTGGAPQSRVLHLPRVSRASSPGLGGCSPGLTDLPAQGSLPTWGVQSLVS